MHNFLNWFKKDKKSISIEDDEMIVDLEDDDNSDEVVSERD